MNTLPLMAYTATDVTRPCRRSPAVDRYSLYTWAFCCPLSRTPKGGHSPQPSGLGRYYVAIFMFISLLLRYRQLDYVFKLRYISTVDDKSEEFADGVNVGLFCLFKNIGIYLSFTRFFRDDVWEMWLNSISRWLFHLFAISTSVFHTYIIISSLQRARRHCYV